MRVSALVGAQVRDPDGRLLGRVRELRAEDGGGDLRVTALLLGRQGVHHRLTGRGGPTHEVAFTDVARGTDGSLTARPEALRELPR